MLFPFPDLDRLLNDGRPLPPHKLEILQTNSKQSALKRWPYATTPQFNLFVGEAMATFAQALQEIL
jgi:hypothetical protein